MRCSITEKEAGNWLLLNRDLICMSMVSGLTINFPQLFWVIYIHLAYFVSLINLPNNTYSFCSSLTLMKFLIDWQFLNAVSAA